MKLPPGIPFLCRLIIGQSVAPLVTYVLYHVLAAELGIVIFPTWAWIIAAAISCPLLISVRIWFKYRSYRLGAACLGAQLPPERKGKTFGNRDILKGIVEAMTTGYPTDKIDMAIEEVRSRIWQYSVYWNLGYATSDPNIVKTILATDFANFEKGEIFHDYMDSVFGTGVFNADGDLWKFHRSMTRPFFSRERIGDYEVFERHAQTTLNKIRERMLSNTAFDFQDLIARFTLDSATEFLFGSCVHSLHLPLPEPNGTSPYNAIESEGKSVLERFPQALATVLRIVSERPRVGRLWALREIFKSKTDEPMAVVNAFLEPILQDALQKKEERAKTGITSSGDKDSQEEDSQTLLEELVKKTSDRTLLHDETLSVMLAGRDAVAAALTFAIYLLCQHPDVLKRLRAEILEHVGPSRQPTYDDVRGMKYLRAVLNETLRLYPPVPFDMRCSIKECTVPNPDPNGKPIYVPAKTPIAWSIINMHRDPEFWGPTAQEYDPDRFIDERFSKYILSRPFTFLPFNGGPRICLGQQFAYNEMSFFMIRLLQHFSTMSLDLSAQPAEGRPPMEWKECPGRKGQEQIRPRFHITMYVEGGLWVKMGEADAV